MNITTRNLLNKLSPQLEANLRVIFYSDNSGIVEERSFHTALHRWDEFFTFRNTAELNKKLRAEIL